MKDLFGNEPVEIIRTIGLYNPYCTLMLPPYNKIETRKITSDRKPGFSFGRYVFYSTLNPIDDLKLLKWAGGDLYRRIFDLLYNEPAQYLNGYILGIGELKKKPWLMKPEDQERCFVKYSAPKEDGKNTWCIEFENVKRIEPVLFQDKNKKSLGNQGIGYLPEFLKQQIKIID